MNFLRNLFGKKQSDSVQQSDLVLAEEYFTKAAGYAMRQNNQPEDWQKAIDLLNEAVRLNPKHAKAQMSLCMCYGGKMDFDSARSHYEILKKLDPDLANRLAQTPVGMLILRGGDVISF